MTACTIGDGGGGAAVAEDAGDVEMRRRDARPPSKTTSPRVSISDFPLELGGLPARAFFSGGESAFVELDGASAHPECIALAIVSAHPECIN